MSDIYPHYRNISNQYNQDQTGIEEINTQFFFIFGFLFDRIWSILAMPYVSNIHKHHNHYELSAIWGNPTSMNEIETQIFLFLVALLCDMSQTLPDLRKLLGTNSLFTQFYPFLQTVNSQNEIIWFQSRNNKFAVFLSLGKISASILQQMENGQIQQQKYFFKRKFST